MRDTIIQIFNIFTYYEAILVAIIILLPVIVLSIASYVWTKSRKLSLIALFSIVPLITAFALSSFFTQEIHEISSNGSLQVGLVMAIIANILNLGILVNEYHKELTQKRFDPDHVTRAHFAATLNMVVVITIFTFVTLPFINEELRVITTVAYITILVTISATHGLSRVLLRDRVKMDKVIVK